jgi:HAD superfamily hydrolase (TIGR01662 family)
LTICGIIFDLGWTLLDFAGDISTSHTQRGVDLDRFLRDQGFDVDGPAIFATYRQEMATLWEVGRPYNYEYPARLAMLRALRRYLGQNDAARLARDALAVSFDSVIPQWQLYPDTVGTLTLLREAGYRLGCVSNTNDGAHVQRMVDHCGLRPWLSPIYTSEEIGLRKPHPYLFELVLSDWDMSPNQVIMVGDTLDADVLGAHNVGMRGVWIDRGHVNPWSRNEDSIAHIVPDATIKQLGELPDLLNNL